MASLSNLMKAPVAVVAIASTCDLSKATYFKATQTGTASYSFINIPADVFMWDLEVNHVSGLFGWPANVRWVGGIAPQNLQTGKIHLFSFRRPQSTGADQVIGSYLPNC